MLRSIVVAVLSLFAGSALAADTTFLLVKSMMGPLTTTITLSVAYFWFRNLVSRSGAVVVLAERRPISRAA